MMNSLLARGATGDNVSRGIALTLTAIVIFGIQDTFAKMLVQDYPPFQITMIRYWAFGAFSLFLALRQAPLSQAMRSKAPVLQALRGLLLMGDIWLFALAIRTVPLAELQAMSMIYPLLVTLFAIPILGEKVGVFRFVAVAVGFAGALVIIRPGGLTLGWDVGFAIGSAVLYAIYITLTRKVSKLDSTSTSMVYVGVIGLVLSSAIGIFYWHPMDWHGVLFVAVVMITTCAGHGLMMVAMSLAPASVVQPFNYFALPWAIVLSYFVFGHLIDPISLIGALVIAGAGLAVMARERAKRVSGNVENGLPGKE